MTFGELIPIVALAAPIINAKQNVRLWSPGERAVVTWDAYWAGQLEQGRIAIRIDNWEPQSDAPLTAPTPADHDTSKPADPTDHETSMSTAPVAPTARRQRKG